MGKILVPQQRIRRVPALVLLTSALLCVGSGVSSCQTTKDASPARARRAEKYVGFSVFGPDWPLGREFATDAERLTYLEEQGYLVAQHTSRLSGNLVRVPISVWSVLGQNAAVDPDVAAIPLYQLSVEATKAALEKVQAALDASLAALDKGQDVWGGPLRWHLWDAFFSGIQKYNAEIAAASNQRYQPVFVDILLTELTPTLIIEAPATRIVPQPTDHVVEGWLWGSYRQLHIMFVRKLIQRYGLGYAADVRAQIPIAVAIEMFNEPDYNWLPDEAKIEKALNPDAYPCDKYITQLHLSQIPENDLQGKGCARHPFFYQEQDLGLPTVHTPLRDFRWGSKFDKYVATFADLHAHVSFAARDGIYRGGAQMVVVSSAVTHVNLDWLVRMLRAHRDTFRYIDKVAIHPYHWPRHDIHDMHFVSRGPEKNWMLANPREFACDYFKRFDFLRQLAALVAEPDQEKSYGLAGKPIWITEFGIPTKKFGKVNAALRNHSKLFIYDRASPVPEGIQAIVWEDIWKAFLDQASADFLRQNRVEALLVYTLRESAMEHSNDDSHSNLAVYRADWSCRMAPDVLSRLAELFRRFRNE
jgi:hypothetical protein